MSAFRLSWQGALWGFLGFNYAVGIDILSKAYHSLHADVNLSTRRSANSEAAGHFLNYIVHLAIFTVWGGYLAGWGEERELDVKNHLRPGSAATFINWGMIIFSCSIFLWSKFLSDTPPLRRFCIRLVQRLSVGSLAD